VEVTWRLVGMRQGRLSGKANRTIEHSGIGFEGVTVMLVPVIGRSGKAFGGEFLDLLLRAMIAQVCESVRPPVGRYTCKADTLG
jgi:hypothetical protein